MTLHCIAHITCIASAAMLLAQRWHTRHAHPIGSSALDAVPAFLFGLVRLLARRLGFGPE